MRYVARSTRAPSRAGKKPPSAADFDVAVAEFFMRLALREARKGVGRTSPNPAVGAVLVKGGRVIARGHHAKAGGPHAEVVALRAAGEAARGADLYTTLEPCDHFGKTPPCSLAILEAGVRRVFYGSSDPNPLVSGRGVRRLKRRGIPVAGGVLGEETDRLYEGWFRFMRDGRPHVMLKIAATMDGRIATSSGTSRWITGEASRRRVHELRDQVDAIVVGVGTVLADDPQLNTRIGGAGRDPLRVILDSSLKTPPFARVLTQESTAKTLLAHTSRAPATRRRRLLAAGAELLLCEADDGRVELRDLLGKLAKRGVVQVLVEGGSEVFGAFLAAGLVDRMLLFQAPKLFGEGPAWTSRPVARRPEDALALDVEAVRVLGGDVLVEARPLGRGPKTPKAEARAAAKDAPKRSPGRGPRTRRLS